MVTASKNDRRNHGSGFRLLTTLTAHIQLNAGHYSSIASTSYAYAVVQASVIKDKPQHLTEQTSIEGSENESKFKCFIQRSNFRTLLNTRKEDPRSN